jgi:hypothetical protein
VLLVDDDRPELGDRREHGRTRPDRDPLLPTPERQPRVVALAVGERRVEHRDLIAERAAEPVDRLRRQRDLRHQHDRALPALPHHAAQQLDVDERLAAPRDAVQQERLPCASGSHPVHDRLLRRRRRVRRRRSGASGERIARDRLVGYRGEAARHQPLEHRRREPKLLEQVRHRRPPAERLEQLVQRALLRRAREDALPVEERLHVPRQHGHAMRLHHRGRRRRAGERHRERRAQHDADRHHVVLGNPPPEREQLRRERRLRVRHVDDRLGRDRVPAPPNQRRRIARTEVDPELRPTAQRHHHARARDQGVPEPRWHRIGEGAEQRKRKRDLGERRRGHGTTGKGRSSAGRGLLR